MFAYEHDLLLFKHECGLPCPPRFAQNYLFGGPDRHLQFFLSAWTAIAVNLTVFIPLFKPKVVFSTPGEIDNGMWN